MLVAVALFSAMDAQIKLLSSTIRRCRSLRSAARGAAVRAAADPDARAPAPAADPALACTSVRAAIGV